MTAPLPIAAGAAQGHDRATGGRRRMLQAVVTATWWPWTGTAQAQGGPDGSTRIATGSRRPHPRLAAIAPGQAVDLGPYVCDDRAPDSRCESIFDYSRISYDPFGHRMLVFGGGHAATGRTDVDAFDLSTLRWTSLYRSMSCDAVAAGDLDARGFHRATGHPLARHTYDQSVIVLREGRGWLTLFSTEAFRGYCHPYKGTIGSVASLPLDERVPTWRYGRASRMPWGYGGTAEYDPVSQRVLLLGGQSAGGWVYDPATDRIDAAIKGLPRAANSSNLVFHPTTDCMFLLDRRSGQVFRLRLRRDDWTLTGLHAEDATGEPPRGMRNWALDARRGVIGGIRDAQYISFEPKTRRWRWHPLRSLSDTGATLRTPRHHAIDYDPVDDIFIAVARSGSSLRTWAYKPSD